VLIVLKSESLNLRETSGPVKACGRVALALPYSTAIFHGNTSCGFSVVPCGKYEVVSKIF
jgi:hypothetical protein